MITLVPKHGTRVILDERRPVSAAPKVDLEAAREPAQVAAGS
jgi:hypothetical protein